MPVIVKDLKTLGVYLIVILAILKFALIPLDSSLKTKRAILNEYIDTYRMRSYMQGKHVPAPEANISVEEERRLLKLIAHKESPIPAIQSETLESVIKKAEKNGLTVVNFELPDAARGKNITGVSVLLRVKGMPKALVGLLKEIKTMERLTDVRAIETAKSGDEFIFTITLTTYRMET
jgi:hypothetical protein